MINKVILICSELWRLKRLHYSEHRSGKEEEAVDKIAAFISEMHLIEAGQTGHFNSDFFDENVNNFVNINTEINQQTFKQIEQLLRLKGWGRRHLKHVLNHILIQYFKDNPELSEIEIPDFKYNKNETY